MKKRILCMAMALILTLGLSVSAFATVSDTELTAATNAAMQYLYDTVPEPELAQIGGEWAILALARSGFSAPASYFARYYQKVEETVRDKGGVLSTNKYTEYARVIVAITAIGKDARNVAGYDLTAPLGDFNKTISQGINGAIWALIALDSKDYPMPAGATATRQKYVDEILNNQFKDGGWALSGTKSDPDMTGMALQALAKYKDQIAVQTAIDKGLARLGKMQGSNGGYTNAYGEGNVESTAQAIVALCELGVSFTDSRFVKNGNSLLDNLLTFQSDDGGFKHMTSDEENDGMSTEQASYALAAAKRFAEGKNTLYRMSDATDLAAGGELPIVTDGSGNIIPVSNGSDGDMSFNLTIGRTNIVLKGNGSSYSISSTDDIACIVLVKNGASYQQRDVISTGDVHTLSLYAGEEAIVAVKGDLNNDGRVNSYDAVRALQTAAGIQNLSEIELKIGDTTLDGRVNSYDAVIALQNAAGIVGAQIQW